MEISNIRAINTFVTVVEIDGKCAVRVTKDPRVQAVDEATFARLINSDFENGVIEVKVMSRLLKVAPDFARGFIGVAFRIDQDNSKFECLYIRPTNGRVEDQLRRNRATQYFSYPDYKYERLRQEAPGIFESYADMGLNEWITMRIEVRGANARLYLNDQVHPVLIVNELKHGSGTSGAIGLWVDVGTEGHFADLKIDRA